MASCTLQKIVNNEAVEFIRIWQTSNSLNEVVDRLEKSDVWLNREERLGNRLAQGYISKKRYQEHNFTTRNLAKSFESYLRYSKGIELKYNWWKCHDEYKFVNLQDLARAYVAIDEAENVVTISPSC